MKLKITDHADILSKRLKALSWLKSHEVRVGLPSSASDRNREILAIQEHGSPLNRIPPRPVVLPTLSSPPVQAAMAEELLQAASSAWEGSASDAAAHLAAAGQAGADAIRAAIDAGVPPPNAPVTVHGGWVYNRKARTGVSVPGKGFDKPLYDTGELYEAFGFEITGRNE